MKADIGEKLGFHGPAILLAELPLLVFGLLSLGHPFVEDEGFIASAAKLAAETGKPYFYVGEIFGHQWGLWHPPTYVYYLSGWIRAFGFSEEVLRFATLLFPVATGILVYFFAAYLQREHLSGYLDSSWRDHPRVFPGLASLIFCISPFVIQNGLLIDIDGSMLAFAVLSSIFLILKSFDTHGNSWKPYALTGILVAVISGIKFGALPALGASLSIYLLSRYGLKSSFKLGLSFSAGMLLFTILWFGVSNLVGLPFAEPFTHNFGKLFSSSSVSILTFDKILWMCWVFFKQLLWLSPPLVLLSIFSVKIPETSKKYDQIIFFLIAPFLVINIIQYTLLIGIPYGFPKYMGVSTPLIAILGAAALLRHLGSQDIKKNYQATISAVAATTLMMTILPDPIPRPMGLDKLRYLFYGLSFGTIFLTLSGLNLVIIEKLGHLKSYKKLVLVTMMAIFLGSSLGMNLMQLEADYSTNYRYKESGLEDTINFTKALDGNIQENQVVVVPADIGFYLGGGRYTIRRFNWSKNPDLIVTRTPPYKQVDQNIKELVRFQGYESHKFGSFLVVAEN